MLLVFEEQLMERVVESEGFDSQGALSLLSGIQTIDRLVKAVLPQRLAKGRVVGVFWLPVDPILSVLAARFEGVRPVEGVLHAS